MKKKDEIRRQKAHTICVMQTVGDTLKEKLKTQIWLSEQTGIHPTTLSRMKNGRVYISAYQMDLLADALEMPLEWLRPKQDDLNRLICQLDEWEG